MKVLVVKLSSLGDVIHTLPALTDASHAVPGVSFDWLVEAGFGDVPRMHPAVDEVIDVGLRRWRQRPFRFLQELVRLRRRVAERDYDLVIDAQGLIKSALVSRLAGGNLAGLAGASAREPIASWFYETVVDVPTDLHAIERTRRLFAALLGYTRPLDAPDAGIKPAARQVGREIMLLHGTTWPSKHYPQQRWKQLAQLVHAAGFTVVLPHGSDEELERAKKIADGLPALILPRTGLSNLASRLSNCAGAISVDSGLGHLAAALGTPQVGLYGPTDPERTGPIGPAQSVIVSDHLPCIPCLKRTCQLPVIGETYPPCFGNATPGAIWTRLTELIDAEAERAR